MATIVASTTSAPTTNSTGSAASATALTTVFTPPSFCPPAINDVDIESNTLLTSCFPGATYPPAPWQAYSPGICPQGYTVACKWSDWMSVDSTPLAAGESAMICCPKSYGCTYASDSCVSVAQTSTHSAYALQIRWKEADLSLLERPPLTSSVPNRAQWPPKGSHTTLWDVSTSCMRDFAKSLTPPPDCQGPGDYYSPAICPRGWTSAATRPVLGNFGPPENKDETAIFCCPSHYSVITSYGCSPVHCVSAATSNAAQNGAAMAAVITAVQVRWAASDLPFLATNPLRPSVAARSLIPMSTSATIATPTSSTTMLQTRIPSVQAISPVMPAAAASLSAVTIHGIPALSPENQLLLGLAFIPLLLAMAFAIGYIFISWISAKRSVQARGQSDRGRTSQIRDSFQPPIISFPVLALLAGFTITAVPLLELGRLSLVQTDSGAPLPVTAFTTVKKRDESTAGAPSPIFVTLPSGTASWPNSSAITRSSYVISGETPSAAMVANDRGSLICSRTFVPVSETSGSETPCRAGQNITKTVTITTEDHETQLQILGFLTQSCIPEGVSVEMVKPTTAATPLCVLDAFYQAIPVPAMGAERNSFVWAPVGTTVVIPIGDDGGGQPTTSTSPSPLATPDAPPPPTATPSLDQISGPSPDSQSSPSLVPAPSPGQTSSTFPDSSSADLGIPLGPLPGADSSSDKLSQSSGLQSQKKTTASVSMLPTAGLIPKPSENSAPQRQSQTTEMSSALLPVLPTSLPFGASKGTGLSAGPSSTLAQTSVQIIIGSSTVTEVLDRPPSITTRPMKPGPKTTRIRVTNIGGVIAAHPSANVSASSKGPNDANALLGAPPGTKDQTPPQMLPETRTLTTPAAPPPQTTVPTQTSTPGRTSAQSLQFISTEREYFTAAFLPTLLAILFTIPWKLIHRAVKSTEPFHRMTQPGGVPVATALRLEYPGLRGYVTPLLAAWNKDWTIAFSATLVYASAVVGPLAAEAIDMRLVGNCGVFDSRGCAVVAQVIPEVVRTLQVVLAIMAAGSVALVFAMRKRSLGVEEDPRSLLAVAQLIDCADTKRTFRRLMDGGEVLFTADVRDQLGQVRLGIGEHGCGYGLHVLKDGYRCVSTEDGSRTSSASPNGRQLSRIPPRMPVLGISIFLGLATVFLVGFLCLILYYLLTFDETPFEEFMDSGRFGGRFLFAGCGVLISFTWLAIFNNVIQLTPYYRMFRKPQPARSSVSLPYATNPYSEIVSSLRQGNLLILSISLSSILADFLPMLLTAIPYHGSTTYQAHIACSWLSVGILGFMISVLVALGLYCTVARPRLLLDPELIRNRPLMACLVTASCSAAVTEREKSNSGRIARHGSADSPVVRYKLGTAGSTESEFHAGFEEI